MKATRQQVVVRCAIASLYSLLPTADDTPRLIDPGKAIHNKRVRRDLDSAKNSSEGDARKRLREMKEKGIYSVLNKSIGSGEKD